MSVSRKVLVVKEQYEGEYECRGEVTNSLSLYNLDKLNALSKIKIEGGLLEKWEKEAGEELEPLNGKEYSFEDIQEAIAIGDYPTVETYNNGTLEIDIIDFEDTSEKEIEQLKMEMLQSSKYNQTIFENEVLSTFFSNEEIASCCVREKLKIKPIYAVLLEDEVIY